MTKKKLEDSLQSFDHGKKVIVINGHKYNPYVTSTKSHKVNKKLNILLLFKQKIAERVHRYICFSLLPALDFYNAKIC